MTELPATVQSWIGEPRYDSTSVVPVEQGYVWTFCAAVQDGNPLYWDAGQAQRITGGATAPPAMLSVWMRGHHWSPDPAGSELPLQVHFDLKRELDLPEAVISGYSLTLHDPVRIGDLLRVRQVLRSVSGLKTTKLGRGRFWVIDVEYFRPGGELAGVESYTAFGYLTPVGSTPERSPARTPAS
jgi:acyl dehydratase